MRPAVRIVIAILLFCVAAFCGFQALAAGEMPEVQRSYRLLDGFIGLTSFSAASWLMWPRKTLTPSLARRDRSGEV
jgi:hypothetical protein